MNRCAKLTLLLVLVGLASLAQTKQELEEKKSRLLKDIEYTNKLLKEAEAGQKTTIGRLNLLNTKISKRQELINTMLRQGQMMERQIGETQGVVRSLETDLDRLKVEYGQMLYYTYKNHRFYDRLMFVFSAQDFNQAYKRMKYFEQYARYRKEQGRLIDQTREALSARADDLKRKRQELSMVLEGREREKLQLSTEVEEAGKMMDNLKKQEKDLRRELEKKKREKERLDKAIARIIEEEIKKSKAKAEADKTSTPKVVRSGFALTPEEAILSSSFAENIGKLPWPSERGVITSTFGEHPHPTLRDIKTNNNGVDIATEDGAKARAVFDGEVSVVIVIPGANKAVMVRHGEFITVYSNLKEVFVKQGDKLKVKQDIGLIATDPDDGRSILHMEVWKGTQKQDPAKWLQAKK